MLTSIKFVGKNTRAATRSFSSTTGLQDVVIVSAARTPIGSIGGSLAALSATELGTIAAKAAIERAKIDPKEINEVIMGNVVGAGIGQAPARQVCLGAGLEKKTVCTTVNKVCSSGLKAIMMAAQTIALGQADVILAGGFESMSNVPYYMEKARYGMKYGNGQLLDGIVKDGLSDAHYKFPMGNCAENTAKKYGITREQQDAHCIEAYKRAQAAAKSGAFKREIAPVQIKGKKGDVVTIAEDEEPINVKWDKIPTLKPVFDPKGSVTAANSSKLNDGAAAVLLMSAAKAKSLGLTPLAKIRGYADAEQDPIDFPTSPALAIPIALERAGIQKKDVDFWEINQAFSVVALANQKILELDPSKVDVRGGGVSIGHPIGSSGARIVTTLLHVMQDMNGKYGVAGICNGGGGASALVIEKL